MEKQLTSGIKSQAGVLNGLLGAGVPPKVLAEKLSVSVKELEELTKNLLPSKDAVEQYREAQHLQLTQIQSKILEAMTADKIETASLSELAKVFSTLKDKELVMQGKATAITGIVGYLIQLEKEDLMKVAGGTVIEIDSNCSENENVVELAGFRIEDFDEGEDLPSL